MASRLFLVKSHSSGLAATQSLSSVTRGSITWTFDTTYQVGQYVTGDYFVYLPEGTLTINSVSPAPIEMIAVPSSDYVENGTWTESEGSTLYGVVDDGSDWTIASDTDYYTDTSHNVGDYVDHKLTVTGSPSAGVLPFVNVRWRKSATGSGAVGATMELWQGIPGSGTLVCDRNTNAAISTAWAVSHIALTDVELANITDWNNLYVRVYVDATPSDASLQVSDIRVWYYRNGSMKNPMTVPYLGQYSLVAGFDPRYTIIKLGHWHYGQTSQFPLSMSAGDVLVSSESKSETYSEPDLFGNIQLKTPLKENQVLHVVSSVPYADQFRPPYVGDSSHRPVYRASAINYDLLPNWTAPTGDGAPNTQAFYERCVQYPWVTTCREWIGEGQRASNNAPTYGREVSGLLGEISCWLCLNNTNAVKEKCAIGLCQIAIDSYEPWTIDNNMWVRNGGHGQGYVTICRFAGALLGDSTLSNAEFYGTDGPSGHGCPESKGPYYGDTIIHTGSPAGPDTLWTIAITGYGVEEPAVAPFTYTKPPGDYNVLYSVDEKGGGDTYRWHHEAVDPTRWDDLEIDENKISGWSQDAYKRIQMAGWVGMILALRGLGLYPTVLNRAYDIIDRWMYEDDSVIRTAIYNAGWVADPGDVLPWGGTCVDSQMLQGTPKEFVRTLYLQERSGV